MSRQYSVGHSATRKDWGVPMRHKNWPGVSRYASTAAIGLVLLGVTAATAIATSGSAPVVRGAIDVAGRSPYAGRHCNIPTSGWVASGGVEAEPTVAINPRNPANRIAIWMDPTRSSINSSYTMTGGRTWTQSTPNGV